MSGLAALCVILLSLGSVITSLHLSWTNRRVSRMEARLHEMEMDRIDLFLMEEHDRQDDEPPSSS